MNNTHVPHLQYHNYNIPLRPLAGMSPMAVTPPMPSSMHTPIQSPLPCGPATNQIPIAANSYLQFQARASVGTQRINQGMSTPTSVKANTRRTKGAKNKTSMISMADAVVDEADEPSGDELDNLKFREVSMARFKRCHEYIAEIFSPYSISSIIPPESPYQSKNVEELKKQIAETQAEIEKMTSEHTEKMKNFTLRTEALSKSMHEIKKCNTTEDLMKIQEKIEKESDFIIEPFDHVTLVQIHNAPDSETDENDQQDMMHDDDDELDEIDEGINEELQTFFLNYEINT